MYTCTTTVQGRIVTLTGFSDVDQKQDRKYLPVPNLGQNWAKFAILK
jgi:hypothetical protein